MICKDSILDYQQSRSSVIFIFALAYEGRCMITCGPDENLLAVHVVTGDVAHRRRLHTANKMIAGVGEVD